MKLVWPAVAVATVLANTETLVFDVGDFVEYVGPAVAPSRPYQGTFTNLDAVSNQTLELAIAQDALPGKYFARVCWPASQPADLGLEYNNGKLVVDVSGKDVVRTSNDRFTADAVDFTVHVSPFVLKVLPEDLIHTVLKILFIGFAAIGAVCMLFLN